MKKRLFALILTVLLLIPTVSASDSYTQEEKTADALNHLGLFLGNNGSYMLENNLTRGQGMILLVRMLGAEDEALATTYETPFTDLSGAKLPHYVGYAYTNNITKGTTATTFSTQRALTDWMFLTLVMRTLGYPDGGENPLYTVKAPYAFAAQLGLIDEAVADSSFSRSDAVQIFWNAFEVAFNGSTETLAERLISQGVFTDAEYAQAKQIQVSGRATCQGIPYVESVVDVNSGSTSTGGSSGSNTSNNDSNSSEAPDEENITFEEYLAMTPQEQVDFFNSFADPFDYVAWYDAAKAEYDAQQNKIEIGEDGTIDIEEIINGGN